MVRLRTNSRQASSLLCTSVVSWTCRPGTFLRACCNRVNMPLDPATATVMLYSSPRSLHYFFREVGCASRGMAASAAAAFSCHLGGRRSRWSIVSRYHLITVFRVEHAPSPCPVFFRDIGSFLLVSTSSLGRNTRSNWWKKGCSIWHLSLGLPWTTEIKLSRSTSIFAVAAERCSAGSLSQLTSALAVGAPASTAALSSAASYKGCSPACSLWVMASLVTSATVSISMQKYGALSIYPIVSKRWNPTSCVSLFLFLGMRKATDGI